jgi:hypothetical protein
VSKRTIIVALVKRRLLIAPVLLAGALVVPATANANTVTVKERYQSYAFPGIYEARMTNVPRLTDGYAPRWLLLGSITGCVHLSYERTGYPPKRCWARGARWTGGHWRVRHRMVLRQDSPYSRFTVTRGRQKIVFNGYS